jgi:hypothetical protein
MSSLIVCRNTESAVLPVRTSEAWALVRQLDFSRLTPSTVKSCSLLIPINTTGHANQSLPVETVVFEDSQYTTAIVNDACMSPFTCGAAVGSLRRVVYKDGAEFVFRLVELSEIQHLISYELIETDATVNVSSVLHSIQLSEVTDSGETFISWSTDFSGDCDQHTFSDAKYKKLDALKDIKRLFK